MEKIEDRANNHLDKFSDVIDDPSRYLFEQFTQNTGRNITVEDFLEVIREVQAEGQNYITVEDAKGMFAAHDLNRDSTLQLDEFILACREIYKRYYYKMKDTAQVFLQTLSKSLLGSVSNAVARVAS